MIDREKTIRKAVARYNLIFPVKGKQLLEECFFCLRGENYLVFKTKDNKVHSMKACELHASIVVPHTGHETGESIFKLLTKPIIIRSLIVKKPVRTCLINLFPVPGISWSRNDDTGLITPPSVNHGPMARPVASRVELTSPTGETGAFTALQKRATEQLTRYAGTPQQAPGKKNFYHLEVIAPGCFPVTIDREMFIPHEVSVGTGTQVASEVPRSFAWPTYDER